MSDPVSMWSPHAYDPENPGPDPVQPSRDHDWAHGTAISTCQECGALVPNAMKSQHRQWHDSLQRIVLRLTQALDG